MAIRYHRALVASRGMSGVVIWTDSTALDECLSEIGPYTSDLGLEPPNGLSVWYGVIRAIWTGHGSKDDFVLEGEFRDLDDDERAAVAGNRNPWVKRRPSQAKESGT